MYKMLKYTSRYTDMMKENLKLILSIKILNTPILRPPLISLQSILQIKIKIENNKEPSKDWIDLTLIPERECGGGNGAGSVHL